MTADNTEYIYKLKCGGVCKLVDLKARAVATTICAWNQRPERLVSDVEQEMSIA